MLVYKCVLLKPGGKLLNSLMFLNTDQNFISLKMLNN